MGLLNKKWTNDEIDFLKLNYPVYGVQYCHDYLKRSKESITIKARRLKLNSTRIKFLYSKINLSEHVKNSKSLTEVLINMGLKAAGGNYNVIKKYIKKYDLDITHFETVLERNKRIGFGVIPRELNDILVVKSTYPRQHLIKRLIDGNLLEYKCVECDNRGDWKGKKLSLQLDHKNGVNDDNRIENLRFLCPNCHSQTPTYSGKNNKK